MNTSIRERVAAIIPPAVSLVYVDYRDCLDSQSKELEQVLHGEINLDELIEGDWLYDSQSISIGEIEKEVREALGDDFDDDSVDVPELVRDLCYERDDSTPVKDLLRNTSSIPVRVSLHSNYDSLESYWSASQGGLCYDGYLKDAIDALRLNPAKLKQAMLARDVPHFGRWPNRPSRDGKEFVKYEQFLEEFENTTSGGNLLTVVALLDAEDLLKAPFKKIRIPKGNNCGFFAPWPGAGSCIEAELLQDMEIELKSGGHDRWVIHVDKGGNGYSMDDVYGPTKAFFGDELTVVESAPHEGA